MRHILLFKGEAYPAPRMVRSDKWRNPPRPCVAKYFAFRDEFRRQAQKAGYPLGSDVNEIIMTFFLPIPESKSKRETERLKNKIHRVKPDLDNLAKAVLDVLDARDQSCYSMILDKFYDDGDGPRIELVIETEDYLNGQHSGS